MLSTVESQKSSEKSLTVPGDTARQDYKQVYCIIGYPI